MDTRQRHTEGLPVTVFVPGPLPGQNEIIAAAKVRFARGGKYSEMKKTWTQRVANYFLVAKCPKFNRVSIILEWIEAHNRRDPDNVMSGKKFILDGMVKAGVIPNDTRKYISKITHKFGDNEKLRPGVFVTVEPC